MVGVPLNHSNGGSTKTGRTQLDLFLDACGTTGGPERSRLRPKAFKYRHGYVPNIAMQVGCHTTFRFTNFGFEFSSSLDYFPSQILSSQLRLRPHHPHPPPPPPPPPEKWTPPPVSMYLCIYVSMYLCIYVLYVLYVSMLSMLSMYNV